MYTYSEYLKLISSLKTYKQKYNIYLKTHHWSKKKIRTKKYYKYRCCICAKEKDLQVHHLNYECLWHENISNDLVLLCKDCHKKVHKTEKIDIFRETNLVPNKRRFNKLKKMHRSRKYQNKHLSARERENNKLEEEKWKKLLEQKRNEGKL